MMTTLVTIVIIAVVGVIGVIRRKEQERKSFSYLSQSYVNYYFKRQGMITHATVLQGRFF